MTRYLLDTNILSNSTRPLPSQPLIDWMAAQADDALFISTLSLAEIRRCILEKSAGKKRRELEAWFTGPEGPQTLFRRRILDMLLASIAIANDCIVVTANERHFQGIPLLNPLRPTKEPAH